MDKSRISLIFILVFINVSTEETAVAPPSNEITKDSGICNLCECTGTEVNCYNQNLSTIFSIKEWIDLTEMKPEEVDISENLFTNVTVMADLPIKTLNLSRCNIAFIKNSSFKELQQMVVLDLSHNKLDSKLSSHAFKGRYTAEDYESLAALRILNLAYNDFQLLNQDLFKHLPELSELDLSGNPLTTIDHSTLVALSSLPMLKVLKMRSCQLKEIPDKMSHTIRYLERLDLSDNQITAVPPVLKEAKNLVYLNLNQNPILKLDVESEQYPGFPQLQKLKELHMCNMPELETVGSGALAGLENLVSLHMSFNPKLRTIDPKALVRPDDMGESYVWPLITEIYLQSNNISVMDRTLLSCWDLVEKIDVTNNPYLCDCSMQWMVEFMVTNIETKFLNSTEGMVCQEPIEMRGYTMKHLYDTNSTMRCVEEYDLLPKKDGDSLGTINDTTVAPPSNETANDTGICMFCDCTGNVVNCNNKNLSRFFSRQEWLDLTELEPEEVNLSENLFTNVTIMPALPIKTLNLSRCKIKLIENSSFKMLHKMIILDLSYNKLNSKLSPEAFGGRYTTEDHEPLAALRTLNLAYNDFHSLNHGLFEHMPELSELDLSGNPLTTIDHFTLEAISSLPMLNVLKLRSCRLNKIPDMIIYTLRYLEKLDLSDNQLTALPSELEEAKNLIYLNLNQNPILRLDKGSEEYPGFPRLRKLKELHMCYMPELEEIGYGALAGLENLDRLHMNFNPKLRNIKARARPDDMGEDYLWPLITEIYLQSNNISVLDRKLLSRWDLVEKIDITNNPYRCDCSTQWMIDFLVPNIESKAPNSTERMVCQEPTEMKGYTMKYLHDTNTTIRCGKEYDYLPKKKGDLLRRIAETTVAPPSNDTGYDTGICKFCECAGNKVNCNDKNLSTIFSRQEWLGLTEVEPEEVDLSENLFTNVTIMPSLPIKTLNLSRCKIEFIENSSFRELQEMVVLDLSHNKLNSKLSPDAFEGLYNPDEYELLAALRTLNLAYNNFHSLNEDLFEHMPELSELDLSGNPFTTIDRFTQVALSILSNLKVLRMRSCQLKVIPHGMLHAPRYLQRLDLSDNKFTGLPAELVAAKNLVYLNLNQNPILKLDLGSDKYPSFPRLRKLKELHMCYMPELQEISYGGLAGLENLDRLHMNFNPKLRYIEPRALIRPDNIREDYFWPSITEIYLQSNNLSVVDRRLLSRWNLVEKIDVTNNPYLCDCTTQWMINFLVPNIESKAPNSTERMVCQEPIQMRGYTLKYLHDTNSTMRCVDEYDHLPKKDGSLLGSIIGLLLGVPLSSG